MILDSSTSSKGDPLDEFRRKVPEDKNPPPPYTPMPGDVGIPDAPGAVPTRRTTLPATPRAGNFVSVSKLNGAIRGAWAIDPSLLVPPALLHPLERGEMERSKRNLSLKTNNGAITADVTLVTGFSGSSRAAAFEASTYNGSVKFSLREASPGRPRPPVKIKLESLNGAIHISVPRSFRGVVVGTTFNGSTKPSEEVASEIQFDKEDGRTRRVFIGDFNLQDFSSRSDWEGDEVNANTKSGSIRIQYVDEVDPIPSGSHASYNHPRSTGGGFLTKLWDALF